MNEKIRDRLINNLFKAVLSLENTEECYEFFEDICTVNEIKAMSQRLEVAKLLMSGKRYSVIEEKTGASSATISRVNRFFQYGADGYKKILGRIGNELEE